MDPKLHIAYNVLPKDILSAAVDAILDTRLGDMEETTHPFEPKLSIPKDRYKEKWALDVMYNVLEPFNIHGYFEDEYFTRFYIHRTGDYLQRHIDPAIHRAYVKEYTLLLYLNTCDGGCLNIFGQDIAPVENMAVVFTNSDDSFHSVKPILRGPRVVYTMGICQHFTSIYKHNEIQRRNTRAVFTPEPGEVWTDEQYILAAR